MNTNTPLNVPYTTLKIAIAIAMYSHSSLAVAEDQPTTRLDAIVVESSNDDDNPLSITKAPLTDKITDKKIKEELIRDNRDLVRYNPEVSIGEVGRYGAKGFNIQGVDGNRVAMLVDGVRVPEVETNEFFSPYGYMNESRFMADVETLQSVEINKGADSLNSGSGAVGGAVMYKSREPDDLIKKGQSVGGYVKSGYTSKNEEWLHAVGVAGKLDKASGLLNYARREGHELKNHDMRSFDSQRLEVGYQFPDDEFGQRTGGGREKSYLYPDPTHYTQDSTLIKFYYQPSEQHKFGVHGSYQYMINQNRSISKPTIGERFGFDENERKAHGISYEYTPNASDWLDNIKFDHTIQRIVTVGDTFVLSPSLSPSLNSDWTRTYRPNYFDTKQFNLQANTLNLLPPENKEWLGEHQLHSGLEYAKQYYDPYNINYSFGSYSEFNSTMLLPMKSDVYSAYLKDNIYFNDKFQIDAGLRYDQHNRQIVNIRDAYLTVLANPTKKGQSAIIDAYLNGSLTAPQKKDAWTWQTTFRYLPKNNLQFDYQVGTGFLMPLAMQSYSGFAQNSVEQVPNPSLKPETSLNQQISVQKSWDNGLVKLTAYHNKYQDFIDSEEYRRDTFMPAVNKTCGSDNRSISSCFVYLNRDSAVSKGVALSANYRLPYQKYGTFDMRGQVAYQQGEANDGTSLLAIQPLNGLIGLRYQPNSERFSMNAVANYIGKKDADQTKRRLNGGSLDVLRIGDTAQLTTDDFSKNTWVYDVYGNLKLTDNFSLQAGVYNLTNEKYMPWDSVRTLALLGVNTMVDDEAKGLNRYTAPGRNFAISLNYEF